MIFFSNLWGLIRPVLLGTSLRLKYLICLKIVVSSRPKNQLVKKLEWVWGSHILSCPAPF